MFWIIKQKVIEISLPGKMKKKDLIWSTSNKISRLFAHQLKLSKHSENSPFYALLLLRPIA